LTKGLELLSDLTVWSKYAKYIPELKRRETWDEIVVRYLTMMEKKYPQLKDEIWQNGQFILEKKVLPSMRMLQFAGKAIEVNHSRGYNCAYLTIDDYRAFSETMFLLLGGTGVGYSVQNNHIEQLPEIRRSKGTRKFLVSDDIQGWADSIKAIMKWLYGYSSKPIFDYSDIRPKGARLVTAGGKAPGPEPLKLCHAHIFAILDRKQESEKLTSLECHDILCHIANAVLAGGIRRSAMISLFNIDDEEMLTCKFGNWWETNEQRGRSNNSAVIKRNKVTKNKFDDIWEKIEASGSGEPGIYFTNNNDWGSNPCCFTGDTKILTTTGYQPLQNVLGDVDLININGDIVNGLVWSNGLKKIITLTLSNKVKIKCTPEHILKTVDNTDIKAVDSKGMRLMPFYKLNQEVNEFTKYGFIQGDGGLGRLATTTHKGLEIHIGEKDQDIFELFGITQEENKKSYYVSGYNEILRSLEFSSSDLPTRNLPKSFIFWNSYDKLMFLKGMYSANGCVVKNQRVSYKTTSKELVHTYILLQ